MFIGVPLHVAVTPGLVQFRVAPPADPETANVPVQAVPVAVWPLKVNVPEKVPVVVAPVTVPVNVCAAYVPLTELPAWVRSIKRD